MKYDSLLVRLLHFVGPVWLQLNFGQVRTVFG